MQYQIYLNTVETTLFLSFHEISESTFVMLNRVKHLGLRAPWLEFLRKLRMTGKARRQERSEAAVASTDLLLTEPFGAVVALQISSQMRLVLSIKLFTIIKKNNYHQNIQDRMKDIIQICDL